MLLSRNSFVDYSDYVVYEEHYQTSIRNEQTAWATKANKQYDVFARKSGTLFQTPYTLTFDNPTECDILIVAGGGAGGYNIGGGAGAGGLVFVPCYPVTPGGTVSVTVGDGGTRPCGEPTNTSENNG